MTMALAIAQAIVAGCLAEARARQAAPLAVMVVDAGGQPVAFARADGATLFRHDIARAKAVGAIGMGMDSRQLAERAARNPIFFQGLGAITGGMIAFSPGGLLVKADGEIIGAVGVSGDTGDCDEACAKAGLRAAGLTGETSA